MSIKMPQTNITFNQLSTTAIERSERGTAVLIVRDDTDINISYVKFSNSTEIDEISNKFTTSNIQYMKDVFTCNARELIVIRMSTDTTLTGSGSKVTLNNALEILQTITKSGWITIADGTAEQFNSLVSWIKDKTNKGYTYKCVVYQVDNIDHMQVVNFYNSEVEFNDERAVKDGIYYLPSLIGILASCNVTRSTTYYTCQNLISCSVVSEDEIDNWLAKGRLFLFIDEDEVKIASGINSLVTTNGNTLTEDMKYIETVEVMNLISYDIRKVFKETYVGKYKNTYINQLMFISSINAYFKDLANDNILDSEYNNVTEIDVEAQKLALLSIGKDVENMTDQEIRLTTYKRNVFLTADIKILNCMENLDFAINLY